MASIRFENGRQYPIDKGPDKFMLMTSQWHGDSRERILVKFRLVKGSGAWVDVIINCAEREDGSGENWLLKGYIVDSPGSYGPQFEAFFSIRNRNGWMKIYLA